MSGSSNLYSLLQKNTTHSGGHFYYEIRSALIRFSSHFNSTEIPFSVHAWRAHRTVFSSSSNDLFESLPLPFCQKNTTHSGGHFYCEIRSARTARRHAHGHQNSPPDCFFRLRRMPFSNLSLCLFANKNTTHSGGRFYCEIRSALIRFPSHFNSTEIPFSVHAWRAHRTVFFVFDE